VNVLCAFAVDCWYWFWNPKSVLASLHFKMSGESGHRSQQSVQRMLSSADGLIEKLDNQELLEQYQKIREKLLPQKPSGLFVQYRRYGSR
jgi:hypothetical protein